MLCFDWRPFAAYSSLDKNAAVTKYLSARNGRFLVKVEILPPLFCPGLSLIFI